MVGRMMTPYSVMLFVHLVAMSGLVSALSLEALALFHLRRAATAADARTWIGLASGLTMLAIGSLVVLLLSGGYLTERMSAWTLAWPKLPVAVLIAIAASGAVSGSLLRALRRAGGSHRVNEAEFRAGRRDPVLTASLGIRIALVVGIVFIVTAKPGLLESLEILGVALILGLVSTVRNWRGGRAAPFAVGAGGGK
jgi:hypothetical protein